MNLQISEIPPAANSQVAYTVPDLLRVLQISRPTLYKMMTSGELKSRKVGGRRLVSHEQLVCFLNQEAA